MQRARIWHRVISAEEVATEPDYARGQLARASREPMPRHRAKRRY